MVILISRVYWVVYMHRYCAFDPVFIIRNKPARTSIIELPSSISSSYYWLLAGKYRIMLHIYICNFNYSIEQTQLQQRRWARAKDEHQQFIIQHCAI